MPACLLLHPYSLVGGQQLRRQLQHCLAAAAAAGQVGQVGSEPQGEWGHLRTFVLLASTDSVVAQGR